MNDLTIHQLFVGQCERMKKNNIDFHFSGDLTVLTGLGSRNDRERHVFNSVTGLTIFLDGYLIGLNYQET